MIESNFQSWKGLDDPVDLVLMMDVLYYISASERKEFFKKLNEQWLTPGGHVVVLSASRTHTPGGPNEVCQRLGATFLSWEKIEHDILEAGFIKQHAYELKNMRDFANLDEAYVHFCQQFINHELDQPVTLDVVRNTIKEVYPDAKLYPMFEMFAVFQKA